MKIIIKYIILIAFIALIGNLAPTQMVFAMVKYNPDIETNITDLQKRTEVLEAKVLQLQLKLDGVQAQVKSQPVDNSVVNKITEVDNKVIAIEQRVSVLERAVNSIQNTVLGAINKAISILDKLLGR